MIVVDANLLVYLLLPTPHAAVAEAVWAKDDGWVAPELVFSEFRNVLSGAARRKDISLNDAQVILDHALELIIVPEDRIDGPGLLSLTEIGECSAYDCEFVWLARSLNLPLVTADRKVQKDFPGTALSPEGFLEK
jgi:predicted nucleic acid-binding protein